jgi:GTP-binding protein Era
MKSGFVAIFGKPNAGKSTLLNALVGEKLAIVSHKSQTTRHRIRAFLNGPDFQIIFSDTPGIITPEYKLHEKMMGAVKSSLEDADLAILLVDVRDNPEDISPVFESLRLKVPAIVVLNKTDQCSKERIEAMETAYRTQSYCREVVAVSALKKANLALLLEKILGFLPEGLPFFDPEELTDLPTRFFAAEMVREKIFELFEQEIPYQATVMVTAFQEQPNLTKISADIIVQRESQKAILLGDKGSMIKKLGMESRRELEAFLDRKVYLELFVKVRPKWRDNEMQLREYGYN